MTLVVAPYLTRTITGSKDALTGLRLSALR